MLKIIIRLDDSIDCNKISQLIFILDLQDDHFAWIDGWGLHLISREMTHVPSSMMPFLAEWPGYYNPIWLIGFFFLKKTINK
jgi:hypothetical protein